MVHLKLVKFCIYIYFTTVKKKKRLMLKKKELIRIFQDFMNSD